MANGQQINFTFGHIKFVNQAIITDTKAIAVTASHSIVRVVLEAQTDGVNF